LLAESFLLVDVLAVRLEDDKSKLMWLGHELKILLELEVVDVEERSTSVDVHLFDFCDV
jgi:hypothetical protein